MLRPYVPEARHSVNTSRSRVRRAIPEVQTKQVLDWIDLGGGRPGPRFWTRDPIDGTKGFLRGRQYAIALALIVDGRVRLAVVACPRLSLNILLERRGATKHGLMVALRSPCAAAEHGGCLPQAIISLSLRSLPELIHQARGYCGRMKRHTEISSVSAVSSQGWEAQCHRC